MTTKQFIEKVKMGMPKAIVKGNALYWCITENFKESDVIGSIVLTKYFHKDLKGKIRKFIRINVNKFPVKTSVIKEFGCSNQQHTTYSFELTILPKELEEYANWLPFYIGRHEGTNGAIPEPDYVWGCDRLPFEKCNLIETRYGWSRKALKTIQKEE